MNILHSIGCLIVGTFATFIAAPIGIALCSSCGFTAVAALVGAVVVVGIIQ